jgi:hypothetical protein
LRNHLGLVLLATQRQEVDGLVTMLPDGTQVIVQQQIAELVGKV